MRSKQEVRIGIIGAGGIAAAHVKHYKLMAGVKIVGVADVVVGRAAAFVADQGLGDARAYDDHKELVASDLDAVSVCTPNTAHYRATVDALQAGRHVLVEKPLSVTMAEGVEMVAAAREARRILSVGLQTRYAPDVTVAKRTIASGVLGKIYFAETGGGRRRGIPGGSFVSKDLAGGGAVLDIGCYSLDTVMYLLGHPRPLTVSAYTSNYIGTSPALAPRMSSGYRGAFNAASFDVEDFGAAMIRLDGNICLLFRISWAMHLDSLGPTVLLGTTAGLKLAAGVCLYQDEDGVATETQLELGKGPDHGPFYRKLAEFVDAVRDGGPAPIPADTFLHTQAILDGIYRSARARAEVEIHVPAGIQAASGRGD